jgi:hypothetical protein
MRHRPHLIWQASISSGELNFALHSASPQRATGTGPGAGFGFPDPVPFFFLFRFLAVAEFA